MATTVEEIEISEQLELEIDPFKIKVLLIDDQIIIGRAIQSLLGECEDIFINHCLKPDEAIPIANTFRPTVILLDLVMPDIGGLTLLPYLRVNPATQDVPIIVLSSREDPKIKAEAFNLGANDYLVKVPDKTELIARIRYHSKAYIRFLERNQAYAKLKESQDHLIAELEDAANYVKNQLPKPLKDVVSISWKFIPSEQLGGDIFGYYWIDDDHLSIYLLDVCGHGVGAALLSISAMNFLRGEYAQEVNFLNPKDVMSALNKAFPVEENNFMFFTLWYGVFNKKSKELTYSSAGHPPAILLRKVEDGKVEIQELAVEGMVIGGSKDSQYTNKKCTLKKNDKLFIYSDGVYEIEMKENKFMSLEDFIEILKKQTGEEVDDTEIILEEIKRITEIEKFEDDYSMIELTVH